MSNGLAYPVPWKLVFGLGPHIVNGTQTSVDDFSRGINELIRPEPVASGLNFLPGSARFILVANHYQRKGMWILHPASALTQLIRHHYGPGDPPVRWIVTANWPRIQAGPVSFRSPGDILLPRVAHTLACYPVSFAGSNQSYTARSIRRILREAPESDRPLGLFPEGVAGSAGRLTEPLAGVERLIAHLAKRGMPVQPVGITETDRLLFKFGRPVTAAELVSAPDAAKLAMSRIADLIG